MKDEIDYGEKLVNFLEKTTNVLVWICASLFVWWLAVALYRAYEF